MNDELFLGAIAADPADRTVRAAYADWLEERNDPRHELVRVCEQMRHFPVYSDDYWRCKARRNELRAGFSPQWLAATGCDGSDYDPVFRSGFPDDWKGRWRVVREFTERWHGIPMPDVGGRLEEVRAAEVRLKANVPPSVREYIAFAHDLFPEPENHQVLRDWYLMEPMPGHPAVSLMIQGEGDMHWAVQLADLGEADPLVHTYRWDYDYDGPDETRPFLLFSNETPAPVSQWAMNYVEAYNRAGSEFAASVRDAERLRQQLAAAFPIQCDLPGSKGRCFEHSAGILARFQVESVGLSQPSHGVLWVIVREGVPWQAVPEFLWEYALRRHICSGMFLSQEDIDRGRPRGIRREAVPPMRQALG